MQLRELTQQLINARFPHPAALHALFHPFQQIWPRAASRGRLLEKSLRFDNTAIPSS